MRSANSDDGGPGSDSRLDSGGRVLEDDSTLRVDTEISSGEEEGVGERLPAEETCIIRGYTNVWNDDPKYD